MTPAQKAAKEITDNDSDYQTITRIINDAIRQVQDAELIMSRDLIKDYEKSDEEQQQLKSKMVKALEFYANEDVWLTTILKGESGSWSNMPATQDAGDLARSTLAAVKELKP